MNFHTSLPRNTNLQKLIVSIISYAYIIVLLYAACYKLFDFGYFLRQLEHSPLLKDYRYMVAVAVPVSEIIIALLLFFPRTRLKGLYGCAAIMSGFTAYIIYILNFAPHIPCSCGGIMATMDWGEHLVFNSLFILLAITGIILQRKTT